MRILIVVSSLVILGLVAIAGPHRVRAAAPDEVSLKHLPSFQSLKLTNEYKVDPYIIAAAKLQAMGKDRAISMLETAASDLQQPENTVITLCRMLFKAKPNGEFRRPWVGGPYFLGDSKIEQWPMEPIEVVDGVPFLIVNGYILSGHAESATDYLAYCRDECDWNDMVYKPLSMDAKRKALEKLLVSTKWKRSLEVEEISFLTEQINSRSRK